LFSPDPCAHLRLPCRDCRAVIRHARPYPQLIQLDPENCCNCCCLISPIRIRPVIFVCCNRILSSLPLPFFKIFAFHVRTWNVGGTSIGAGANRNRLRPSFRLIVCANYMFRFTSAVRSGTACLFWSIMRIWLLEPPIFRIGPSALFGGAAVKGGADSVSIGAGAYTGSQCPGVD